MRRVRRAHQTGRILRAVGAAVVGLLVLAGCVRIEGELSINGTSSDAPDTVSGTMLVAVSDEWAIAHGEDPTNIPDAIAEELAANPDSGLTGEPYEQDGYTGTTLTFDDVPIDRLTQSTDGALSITRDGDAYVVRGDLSALDRDPDDADAADTPPWTAAVSITFPEDVTDHNGTLDGRTVSWELDESSEDATMYAMSAVGPISWWTRVPVALWVLVGLAAVGAVVAGVLGRRFKRRQAAGDGGFRARQASAGGGSTTKLDAMLADARRDARKKKDRG